MSIQSEKQPELDGAGDASKIITAATPDGQRQSQSPVSPRTDIREEQELDSRMLQIQAKRFYLDVKQNWRGRFIKIAEVAAGGRKSRLIMSMGAAVEFRDRLADFQDFYSKLGAAPSGQQPRQSPGSVPQPQDGQLKTEVMLKENRRYYIDLKENARGRFLRVTQAVARGMPGQGQRSQIAIPAEGMQQVHAALVELLDKFGDETAIGFRNDLPEPRQLRVENKSFYFDVGQNSRGVFMRLSEVKNNYRTSVTIPERSWTRFRDVFVEMCKEMGETDDKQSDGVQSPLSSHATKKGSQDSANEE